MKKVICNNKDCRHKFWTRTYRKNRKFQIIESTIPPFDKILSKEGNPLRRYKDQIVPHSKCKDCR